MVFQIGISAKLKNNNFLTGKKEKPIKDEDPQGMNASPRKDGQAIDVACTEQTKITEYTDYTDKISYKHMRLFHKLLLYNIQLSKSMLSEILLDLISKLF